MNELKQTPYKIYVDLDGTLVDFVAQTKKYTGHTPDELQSQGGDPKMWGEIKKFGIDFWKNMPWISDSKKMWNILKKYNPKIVEYQVGRSDISKSTLKAENAKA